MRGTTETARSARGAWHAAVGQARRRRRRLARGVEGENALVSILPPERLGPHPVRTLAFVALVLLQAAASEAQTPPAITCDGTLGTSVTQSATNVNAYTVGGGTIRVNNLFHSFGLFSVPTSLGAPGSATFTGPSSIANIVSRVTGGQASTIDGLVSPDRKNGV